jgi:hypothetical protein
MPLETPTPVEAPFISIGSFLFQSLLPLVNLASSLCCPAPRLQAFLHSKNNIYQFLLKIEDGQIKIPYTMADIWTDAAFQTVLKESCAMIGHALLENAACVTALPIFYSSS